MCLAIPGKILTLDSEGKRMAEVDFGGTRKRVYLDFVPDAKEGDYVLVHVGVALQKVDEQEAKEIFSYLQQLGEADPDEGHVEAVR